MGTIRSITMEFQPLLAFPSNPPRTKSPIDESHLLPMRSKCSFAAGSATCHAPSVRGPFLTRDHLAVRMQHISPNDGIFRLMLWLHESPSTLSGKHNQFESRDLTRSPSLCFGSSMFMDGSISYFQTSVSGLNTIVGYWIGPDIDDGWGYAEASVNQIF